jgi:hypothetical protein
VDTKVVAPTPSQTTAIDLTANVAIMMQMNSISRV